MNIVITGASRGIGFETALALSKNPEHKILAVARSADKLNLLKRKILSENSKTKIFILPLDLKEKNYREKLSEIIKKEFDSRVDILVNNAGILINKPFKKLSDKDWQEIYDVNVFGVVRLIKTLLPFMGKKNKSHIVNISSMGGFQGSKKFAGLAAYASSKGALTTLSGCLAEEFKDRNIAVNCLCLGGVQTEMYEKAFPGHKALMNVSEIAQFISDFALTGHKTFNGKVLPVTVSIP